MTEFVGFDKLNYFLRYGLINLHYVIKLYFFLHLGKSQTCRRRVSGRRPLRASVSLGICGCRTLVASKGRAGRAAAQTGKWHSHRAGIRIFL